MNEAIRRQQEQIIKKLKEELRTVKTVLNSPKKYVDYRKKLQYDYFEKQKEKILRDGGEEAEIYSEGEKNNLGCFENETLLKLQPMKKISVKGREEGEMKTKETRGVFEIDRGDSRTEFDTNNINNIPETECSTKMSREANFSSLGRYGTYGKSSLEQTQRKRKCQSSLRSKVQGIRLRSKNNSSTQDDYGLSRWDALPQIHFQYNTVSHSRNISNERKGSKDNTLPDLTHS